MHIASLGLLLVCAVYVKTEDCPSGNVNIDCIHMTCDPAFHRECIRGVCTCSSNVECVLGTDCGHGTATCSREWHCVDNRCRCGFFG